MNGRRARLAAAERDRGGRDERVRVPSVRSRSIVVRVDLEQAGALARLVAGQVAAGHGGSFGAGCGPGGHGRDESCHSAAVPPAGTGAGAVARRVFVTARCPRVRRTQAFARPRTRLDGPRSALSPRIRRVGSVGEVTEVAEQLVGGAWVPSAGTERLDVVDPRTEVTSPTDPTLRIRGGKRGPWSVEGGYAVARTLEFDEPGDNGTTRDARPVPAPVPAGGTAAEWQDSSPHDRPVRTRAPKEPPCPHQPDP